MEYEVIFKNEKIKSYRLLTLFIVAMNTSYFLYLLLDPSTRHFAEIALGTLAVYVLYRWMKTRKQKVAFYFDEWVFFALMLLWIDNYVFAILNLVFMLQYTVATQPTSYKFTEEIKQKNFPWKKYQWSDFSNIVLKDNILTMDLKNNKVIQGEVLTEINEKEFNKALQLAGRYNAIKY